MDKGPAQSATLTAEDALKMYEKLAALRRIETASGNLYKEKIIRGFCHLYSGIVFIILLKKKNLEDMFTSISKSLEMHLHNL